MDLGGCLASVLPPSTTYDYSNRPGLGVATPREALLYIVLVCYPAVHPKLPVGPDEGLHNQVLPFTMLASREDITRAWPGGIGYAKIGANYGPSMKVQQQAIDQGYSQLLWLFGPERFVSEAGGANFFVVLQRDDGQVELVTAPLDDRTILAGITRKSIIELATERLAVDTIDRRLAGADALTVSVRPITMRELVRAADEDRFLEAFVTGTAYFVTPVRSISFRGQDLVPKQSTCVRSLRRWLSDIQNGEEDHEWAHIVAE